LKAIFLKAIIYRKVNNIIDTSITPVKVSFSSNVDGYKTDKSIKEQVNQ